MIGSQVLHFKMLDKVGQGGMGEVYLALDTQLDRKVALKFLPAHLSGDPDFKSRFQHEAKAAAALNHPNIITVYQVGEHDGRLFMVLELVEGQTLEKLIEAGDVRTEKALDIILQVCEGLKVAHSAGIVHRDIKPANILIDKTGRVRILDFGLAKSRKATTDTQAGTTVGTVQYESPEQGRGSEVDERSDLFSVGVLLYEMIAGRRPFQGEFTDAIRYAIANEVPEPLARYKADVPDELERIVSKLLEKDPDLRYQTAGGVISDLKQLKRDSGPRPSGIRSAVQSAARPVAPAPASERKRRLLPIVIPAGVAVLALLAALIFRPWKVAIEPTHEAVAGQDRLAVMYFENMTDPGDADRKGSIVANLLISALSGSEYLQVVSSQRLFDILKQLGQEDQRVITPAIASQVARKADAKWMITGSIMQSSPNWVLSAQLVDVATGNVLASPTVRGQAGEEIFDVVDRLTAGLKSDMALPAEVLAELDRPVTELTSGSEDAYAHYIGGRDLANQFRRAEAEQEYLAALAIDSTFAMAHYALAGIRLTLWNDPVGARNYLENAVKYSDRASNLDRQYIHALHEWFNNHVESAVATYEQIIRDHPDEKDAYQMLAQAFRLAPKVQNLHRAIELHQKMLELDPTDADVHNSLAYLYNEVGNYEKSLEAVNEYIRMEPDKPNPYDSKAELQARNGQVEASLASYMKAIEIDRNFSSAYDGAIAMNMFLGRYDEAERLARFFLDQQNPDARRHGQMLVVFLDIRRGHFKGALKRLDLALSEAGGPTTASMDVMRYLDTRADIQLLTGDRNGVHRSDAQMAGLATELDSTGRFAYGVTSGAMIRALHAEDRARIDSLWSTLGLDAPRLMGGGYDLAQACVAMVAGQGDSALSHLQTWAGETRTFNNMFWMARGYAVAGRLRDAIQAYEQALNDYGSTRWNRPERSVLAHYELAQVYEKSGLRDQAVEQYRAFLEAWKDADTEIAQIKDARSRLAALGV